MIPSLCLTVDRSYRLPVNVVGPTREYVAATSLAALATHLQDRRRIAETDPDARPVLVVCLSGRGDKDVDTAIRWFGLDGSVDKTAGA